MPIVERNPQRAFERFEDHMATMVRSVLPLPPAVTLTVKWREEAGVLEFTQGGIGTSVPIETRVGTLYLSLNQDLTAIREGRAYRLRTKRYQYKILPSNSSEAEAVIRWEFNSETDDRAECRNHVHFNIEFPVGHSSIHLRRTHVPTAWVLVEHVLRFLFHDLHVPPVTHDWPDILRASETKFYEKFTGKRYRWRP